MAIERTFSIVKPDAVAKNVIGEIYSRFEKGGLKIVASKMLHLTREQAEGFYAVHKERPFFKDLVEFMISGPVMVQVLEGEDQVALPRGFLAPGGGSLTGGLFLIVLGGILLANTALGISLDWLEDWWPLAPILFGVYLVGKSVAEKAGGSNGRE